MTKQQLQKIKMQILGLHYDAIRKRTKAVNLSNNLMKHAPYFRFTAADYRAFYRSRGIKW
jgi:hypothetical protein